MRTSRGAGGMFPAPPACTDKGNEPATKGRGTTFDITKPATICCTNEPTDRHCIATLDMLQCSAESWSHYTLRTLLTLFVWLLHPSAGPTRTVLLPKLPTSAETTCCVETIAAFVFLLASMDVYVPLSCLFLLISNVE